MGDEAPDAWLKGALLHAPDAQANAPSALTHNILRQSRLALSMDGTTPSKRLDVKADGTPRSRWLVAAWNQLTRPQVAAGFASLMVVTLAGVLWWDKPLDEKGDPPMAAAAPSPQRARARAPAPTAPGASPATDAQQAAGSGPQAIPNRYAAPEAAQDKEASASRAEALAKSAAESPTRAKGVESAARSKQADAPRLEESKSHAKQESARTEVAVEVAPAPVPVPVPAPAPAPLTTSSPTPTPTPTPTPEVAPATAAREDGAAVASAAQNKFARTQSAPRAAPAAAATGNAQTAESASPFSSLLASVIGAPDQWRWQADSGELQAVTPALQNWLRLLGQSAGSRWVNGGSTMDAFTRAEDTSVATVPNLRLTTGASGARIVLVGNNVTLQRGNAWWTVALTPQAADALRKAWPQLLR